MCIIELNYQTFNNFQAAKEEKLANNKNVVGAP